MSKIDWDEIMEVESDQSSSSNSVEFFSPKIGSNLVRLVGKPHMFYCHWNIAGAKRREVCLKTHDGDDTPCPLCEVDRHSARYITLLLDKEDKDENGVAKLKVYEGGISVFKVFKKFKNKTNINPGGTEGPDWDIDKTVADKNNPFSTEYTVMPEMGDGSFSQEEVRKIKEADIDLANFYKQPKDISELKTLAKRHKAEVEHGSEEEEVVVESQVSDAEEESVDIEDIDMDMDDEVELEDLEEMLDGADLDF
jgi:hypothetical protein